MTPTLPVLPKSTPEQRYPLYEDVETLIAPGFLSHPVSIEGVHLCLRSLGPGDQFVLRARVENSTETEWRRWAVASAIWMVDGYVLLGDSNAAPWMMQRVRSMPRSAQGILFSLLMGLFARHNRAVDATESYCYESASRFRWKTYGGHSPGVHSGIPGADHLGTNSVQRIWTFHNEIEDQRIRDDALWEGFKLTASAQAPKGVKKIDQRDRQARQSEINRREALQDRFYYTRIGVMKPTDDSPGNGSRPQLSSFSKSTEDLEGEMYRWVSGQEDEHDQIVTDYKRRVAQAYEHEKRARAEQLAAFRAHQELQGASTTRSPLVGYTSDQLAAMLRDRGAGRPGMTVVTEGQQGIREHLYQKYIERAPDAGALRAVDGRLDVADDTGEDLTQQLAGRRVPFRTESEEE